LASAGGFLARSIACESPELTALEVIDIGGLVGLRRCWWHGLGRLLRSGGGRLGRTRRRSRERTSRYGLGSGGEGRWAWQGLRRCGWHGLGRLLRSGWRRLGRTSRRSRERPSRYGLGSGWEGLWSWQVLRCSCEG